MITVNNLPKNIEHISNQNLAPNEIRCTKCGKKWRVPTTSLMWYDPKVQENINIFLEAHKECDIN